MRFTEHFGLKINDEIEWFDPLLNLDTKLFIDPFLIYDNERGIFEGSHETIIKFFDEVFQLLAIAKGNSSSAEWQLAFQMLLFPEVPELCLGYVGVGNAGAGSGADTAKKLCAGFWRAIEAGIKNTKHFEEVQIFQKGIGPDRISDAIAKLLRDRFCRYTSEICNKLQVPTKEISFREAEFDYGKRRWVARSYQLPINTLNKKKSAIILVPKRYLRPLPTINADDYWEYCYDSNVDLLRNMFGDDITRSANKEEIVKLATEHPETRAEYIKSREDGEAEAYDFPNDPKGFIKWYEQTREYVLANPVRQTFDSQIKFSEFVEVLLSSFKNHVENHKGWALLWNDNETHKAEEAAQLLFKGIAIHYCRSNNIDISSEANIGRGPVDFKVSSGYRERALIEVKLAKNTKFWHGLNTQLPIYLKAEGISERRFLVICYTKQDFKKIEDIERRVQNACENTGFNIKVSVVDARLKPDSASKAERYIG
jgi:hypothetical protein